MESDSRYNANYVSYSVDEYYTEDDSTAGVGLGKNTYHMHMCTDDRIDPEFGSFSHVGEDVSSIPLPSYPSPFEKKASSLWNQSNSLQTSHYG